MHGAAAVGQHYIACSCCCKGHAIQRLWDAAARQDHSAHSCCCRCDCHGRRADRAEAAEASVWKWMAQERWLWLMLRSGARPGGAPAGVLGMLLMDGHKAGVLEHSASLSQALLACKHAHICLAAALKAAVLLTAPKFPPCVFPGS